MRAWMRASPTATTAATWRSSSQLAGGVSAVSKVTQWRTRCCSSCDWSSRCARTSARWYRRRSRRRARCSTRSALSRK
eukprot:2433227-Prymnesium_polylepis.1